MAAISIFKDIGVALKDTGGAASDYQSVISHLESLLLILQEIEALRSTQQDLSYINAICGQAQVSHETVKAFAQKIARYEKDLGVNARRGFRHGAISKTKWATTVAGKVAKLRQTIESQTIGLKLLLDLHGQ